MPILMPRIPAYALDNSFQQALSLGWHMSPLCLFLTGSGRVQLSGQWRMHKYAV